MKIYSFISKIANSNDSKEVLGKSVSSFFFRVVSYIFGFAFIFLIANFFSVETQGVFSIIFTLLSFLSLVSKLGIQTSMVKWLSNYFYLENFGKAKFFFIKIYKLILSLAILLGFILYSSAEFISIEFFHKANLIAPIKIISICVPFIVSTDIIASYFMSKKAIKLYSFYNFASKFILPLFFLSLFIFSLDLNRTLPIYAYTVGIIITGVFAFVHVFRDLQKINSDSTEEIPYKDILKTSLPLLLSSSLVMIMWWSDTFILGVYKTEAEVGIYSVAVKLATIASFVYNAVTSILLPKIAQYYKNDKILELKNTIQYSAKLIIFVTLPIVIVIAVFSRFFLSIFGTEYVNGYLILLILLVAQFTNALTGPVGPFLSMSGLERQQFIIVCLALLFNLVISFFLVENYGGEGVALGSAIGMMFWNITGAIYIKVKLKYQTWIKF